MSVTFLDDRLRDGDLAAVRDGLASFLADGGHGYVMGLEQGESGTPHIQGYLQAKQKIRFKQVVELLSAGGADGPHVERARSPQHARDYCAKDGDVVANIQYRKPLKFPVMDLPWERDILELISGEPDDRTIHWYWEPVGNVGKSTFCKYLYAKHNAAIVPQKASDAYHILAKREEEGKVINLVVFDLPRNSEPNYECIEKIKNGFFVSGKYEGAELCIAPPHVIVFSNEEPQRWQLSEDRWNVVEIKNE